MPPFSCRFLLMIMLLGASAGAATAEPVDEPVRIGVLNDQTGPFTDLAGPGSVIAARMAVDDFGKAVLGRPIEILSADHQNKPDIGTQIARRWYDIDHVSMIVDILNSAIALSIESLARERNRIVIGTSIGSPDFTGKTCAPTAISWTLDTYALSNALVRKLVAEGKASWFFITVDYAFGQSLEADAAHAVLASGGKVIGDARYPLNSADFSSYLLRAQSSGAKVIALANAGQDMVTAMKQAAEFGMKGTQTIVGLDVYITDIHSLGLTAAQNLVFANAFYWDQDAQTRAWSRRFFSRHGSMPTQAQASVYSAVLHYLKAVKAAGTLDATQVMAKMRQMPVEDFFARNAYIRADGRLMHDMYLMQVKTPEESKEPWDYLKRLSVIPADQAFRSLAEGGCPLGVQAASAIMPNNMSR